ncbi:Transcriptional regulator, GntR family with aminotransferase domain [Pseudodesulfovibrio profundus]|uniref:Transcriptional regulator, GntR family with aminotransferase domain n=1 Tax=Pseudodesulfovibrio profundus TaxID=57320 RepID=A0A2C8F8W7_9BACT|nr:PLP-dependent aminotransferase family protein [Pseudodesulfovibrio profundus]SOB58882.1 Transcriptional regulator, GntR family with aminotransferase domain [Pseudodesulfovibrio profundus]
MTIYAPNMAKDGKALYKALADAIERDISDGKLVPGERLPTHRDMAEMIGINVSTVTKGYQEAERRGLLSGTVGRGTFVASDALTATAMVAFEPAAPGSLEMGLISPFYHLDPDLTDGFRKIARRKDPSVFMRYTDPRGLPEHREAGAKWASRYGMPAEAEDIIVCAGSQNALTCTLSGLFTPGDRIATDALTYPGLKTLAAMLGIRLVPIAMDEQGMVPEALETACRRNDIRGVYLMPSVHNPTTATMSSPRRDSIARVAQSHDLIVIEDDAYALTDPTLLPPVASRIPHRSVYIAGVSKNMAAGLRIAFLVTPKPYRQPLAQAMLNTIWMAPPLNAELTAMWINDGTADAVVEAKRQATAKRYMLACDVLEDFRFRGKPTGFFIWLELPEPWTGTMLEKAASKENVNVFGAEKFTVGDSPAPAAARISLTGAETMEEFCRGLWIIRNILTNE